MGAVFERRIYPSAAALQSAINRRGKRREQIREVKVESISGDRVVRKLGNEGLFDKFQVSTLKFNSRLETCKSKPRLRIAASRNLDGPMSLVIHVPVERNPQNLSAKGG